MAGFSAVSESSLCTTISHRVLAAAVELDEVDEVTQFSGLPDRLRAYSKVAESLAESITRATAVSETLQEVLSGFLDSCAQAAAVVEKEIKMVGSGQANPPVIDSRALSEFERWTALATQAFELLQKSTQVSNSTEQDAILRSSGTKQILKECNRASRSVIRLSSQLVQDDDDSPPGYGDSVPEYPNDVKDPSLFETAPAASSASPAVAGPSQPKQNRGGLASLSEAFKAMTAPFRYKPEPLVVALCEASARGNINHISSLISSGANVNGRDESGKTPIVRAIEGKQINAVSELLDHGASREVCDTAKKLPPLFWAAEGGDLEIAALLLQRGCDPREKTMFGSSYFADTVSKGNVEMVQLLLNYGADVNATDSVGRGLIFHAYSKGSMEMVKLLQSRGANVNARDISGSPIVVLALQDGRIDMLKFLLDHGADVNSHTITGSPLLIEALQKGRLDVIKMLLDKGANPNVSDITGNPIILVVIKSSKFNVQEKTELARLLLSRGANPNVSDSWTWSAMSYIIDKGHTELIPLFIESGADPNQTIATGDTLLLYAIETRQNDLVAQLLRHGANPNAVDKKSRTPLMQALRKRDTAAARLLVQHGADPNKEGMVSPLAFARALGDDDIAAFLCTHGATPEADDNIIATRPVVPNTQATGQPRRSARSSHPTVEQPPDYDAVLKQ